MSARRRAPQPLVSVIVPVFNQRRFLPETIACLAAQSHPSMETIFINDGSTDGSESFLDALCVDSVRVIHQENRGPSAARNAGLRAARGDFIQFLDADDLLAPDKLAHDVAYLLDHPEVDVVTCDAAYFRDSLHRTRPVECASAFGDWSLALLAGNPLMIHAPLLTRRAVELGGEFDEGLRGCEDWDFWLRLAWSGAKARFVPGVRAYCELHEAQSSRDPTRMIRGAATVLGRVRERLADRLHEPGIRLLLVASHTDWGLRAQNAGATESALDLLQPVAEWVSALPSDYSHRELGPSNRVSCWARVAVCFREENHVFARALKEWNHSAEGLSVDPSPAEVRALLQSQHSFVRSGDPRLVEPARRASRLAKELCTVVRKNKTEQSKPESQSRPERNVEEVLAAIKRENVRRLLIYGAGEHTRWLLSEYDLSDFEIVGIMDDDSKLWGTSLLDIPIMAPKSAAAAGCDAVLISSDEYEARMTERARHIFPITRVYGMYRESPTRAPVPAG